jgi:phenylalanyl-tRNA synthetase beta subunit
LNSWGNYLSVDITDVNQEKFRGKNVPSGQKSMAYAFTYRHAERTLTDAEVNAAHEKLVELLKQRLQATVMSLAVRCPPFRVSGIRG